MKLTEIITAEIEKKYKYKILQVIEYVDNVGKNYKSRINDIEDEVIKMSQG